MKKPVCVYHPDYFADIGIHVFPMQKFKLLHDRLIAEGHLKELDFSTPEPANANQVKLIHGAKYVEDMFSYKKTERTMSSEIPITEEIIRAFALAAGGSIMAARLALKNKTLGMNLTGGFHHAFAGHAEGFCYINDVAVAIRFLQQEGLGTAAVVDCDLHQGNGTAKIFENDTSVYTYSIHQEDNYPVKEKSNLDRGLPDGVGDKEYLSFLEKDLNTLESECSPELVFYLGGGDPYQDDLLGGLRLSLGGLRRRDELVLSRFFTKGIPVVSVLAGGYARSIQDTVDIHYNTCEVMFGLCEKNSGEG